jgi:hypothetical protein
VCGDGVLRLSGPREEDQEIQEAVRHSTCINCLNIDQDM